MASDDSTCPYCNATLPPLAAPPAGERVPCPRCGEPVPGERFPVERGERPWPESVDDEAPPPGKQKTLTILLGVMGAVALVTLVFALLTTGLRQGRHPKVKGKQPDETEVAKQLLAPAQLRGLDYLPKGTNFAAGLHLASLLQEPAGAALLAEPRPALLEKLTQALDQAGLKTADVDHVVGGVRLTDEAPLPLFTTVVVTRAPYHAEAVARALRARGFTEESKFQGRPVYAKKQGAAAWHAAPRVLVLSNALLAERKDRFLDPTADENRELRRLIAERLNKQSRLWAVGDLSKSKAALALLAQGLPKVDARWLSRVEAFAVGARVQDRVTLLGDFYTGNAQQTQELRKYLEALDIAGAQTKVEAPPQSVTERDAQWVTWQLRAEPATVRGWLDRK